jgi:alpha-1,3-mannosyltransferase
MAVSSFMQRDRKSRDINTAISPAELLYIVFSANFIGILCARSLHYQFYSWWVSFLMPHSLSRTVVLL